MTATAGSSVHDTTTAEKLVQAGRSFTVTFLSAHEDDFFEWAADGSDTLLSLVRRASERPAR